MGNRGKLRPLYDNETAATERGYWFCKAGFIISADWIIKMGDMMKADKVAWDIEVAKLFNFIGGTDKPPRKPSKKAARRARNVKV